MATTPSETEPSVAPEEGPRDTELLERFIQWRDEAAFEVLLQRHGPMVLGVCRRILRSESDAEDAFQATFLVLARRAASLKAKSLVGNFLYGVAIRTAKRAKAMISNRRAKEREAAGRQQSETEPPIESRLLELLDEELQCLPDIYRAVIVLCDLEGRTIKEAARQLGCPQGTIGTRLARGRNLLSRRFARHGLLVTGGAIALALTGKAATAEVPPLLTCSTVKGASFMATGQVPGPSFVPTQVMALTKGVLKTMLLSKFKIASGVLTVFAFATASAAVTHHILTDKPVELEQSGDRWEKDEKIKKGVVIVTAPDDSAAETKKAHPVAETATEKSEGGIESRVVSGVVKGVDAKKNIITIDEKGAERSFKVTEDIHIAMDGRLGRLAELLAGTNVTLSMFVDHETTGSIQAEGPWIGRALVTAVDREKSTITIDYGHAPIAGRRTLNVAKDASIAVDGKPGSLAAIPTGASVDLRLSVDQKTARSVAAEGPWIGGALVTEIDAEKNTVTIEYGHAPIGGRKTVNVAKDADIRIDGNSLATLTEVPEGAFVNLTLSVDLKTIRSIRVYGPAFRGVLVKAVDIERNTITIDNDKAPLELAGLTFPVARDATIAIDGKPGNMLGLPKGAVLNLTLSVDQKAVRSIEADGPTFRGVLIKAVDVERNAITIDNDKAPLELAGLTFPLVKDAIIVIDGKPGNMLGLPKGAILNLTLSVDQKAVRSIEAEGLTISGVVQAVDAEKNTITVDGRTFSVARNANIALDGKVNKLAGIPEGAQVTVLILCVDQKTARLIHARRL